MKKLSAVFLSAIFIWSNIFCQPNGPSGSGYVPVNPAPCGNHINGTMARVYAGLDFAVGEHGTCMKSTNGGTNYNFLNIGTESDLYAAVVITTSIYVVCGATGIYRTMNSGNSWQNVVNNTKLYSVGYNSGNIISTGDMGRCYRSTDNGASFILNVINPAIDFYAAYLSAGFGLVAGTGGAIYVTTNNGTSWLPEVSGTTQTIKSIAIINYTNAAAVGNGGLFIKTTDQGQHWSTTPTGTTQNLHSIIEGCDSLELIAVGDYGLILRSTDFGQTWTPASTPGNAGVDAVAIDESHHMYAYGEDGITWESSDCGMTWYNPNAPITEEQINTEIVPRQTIGLDHNAAGDTIYLAGNHGAILKTTNQGANWTALNSGTADKINSGYFISNQTGWVCTDNGSIRKTTDGGASWVNQITAGIQLNTVFFINSTTGLSAGSSGIIRRTTNSGTNWVTAANISFHVYGITFIDASTGIAVCETGYIFRTTNGGLNWSQVNNGSGSQGLLSVSFANSTTGVASGSSGTMFRTTDAGLTWNLVTPITGNILWCINFADANTGYACGSNLFNNGSILKTTNAGATWFRQNSGTNKTLYAIVPLSGDIVIASGEKGNIIKTTNGGNPIGVQTISSEVPKQFLLQQNYPNPFNPNTVIRFQIKGNGLAKLTVYDILGREVETLVNEFLKPGSYEVDWNALNNPSGVYFYKLVTGGFSETKKMVLLK